MTASQLQKSLLTLLFLFQIHVLLIGQVEREYTLQVHVENDEVNLLEDIEPFPSFDSLINRVNLEIDSLIEKGYLEASLDSTSLSGFTVNAFVHLGPAYILKELKNGNVNDPSFNRLKAFHVKDERNVSWPTLQKLKRSLLEELRESGYLNARVWMDDFVFSENEVSCALYTHQGNAYKLDSLILNGNVAIKHAYLKNYFSIKEDQPINSKLLKRITERSARSTFYELATPPAFYFVNDSTAHVVLELKERNSNEFDLIFGFLPNPNPQLSDRKLLLTGEGALKLYNPFGAGKRLALDYKQLQPESPRVNVDFEWPFFMEKPLGASGTFDLIKQDSSFVSVNYDIGAQYNFGGTSYLRFFFQRTNSFLQTIDTTSIRINKSLDDAIDYDQNLYGVQLNWDKRNSIRNSRKGYYVHTRAGVGNREIEPNNTILNIEEAGFDFSELYNGLNDRQLTFDISSTAQLFLPLKQRSTVLLQNRTGIRDYEHFFENDLFRLGGITTIRGVDEQSVLASQYSITTLEYRFLLGDESFFSVFSDGAWVNDEREKVQESNFYTGVGTGIDIATKAGIFTLNLAVAQDQNTSFDFNRSRIHIGYVNRF